MLSGIYTIIFYQAICIEKPRRDPSKGRGGVDQVNLSVSMGPYFKLGWKIEVGVQLPNPLSIRTLALWTTWSADFYINAHLILYVDKGQAVRILPFARDCLFYVRFALQYAFKRSPPGHVVHPQVTWSGGSHQARTRSFTWITKNNINKLRFIVSVRRRHCCHSYRPSTWRGHTEENLISQPLPTAIVYTD